MRGPEYKCHPVSGRRINAKLSRRYKPSVLSDLLCCPFCGGEAAMEDKHPLLPTGERDTFYRVGCLVPECSSRTNWWYPMEAAIQAWNRRAT